MNLEEIVIDSKINRKLQQQAFVKCIATAEKKLKCFIGKVFFDTTTAFCFKNAITQVSLYLWFYAYIADLTIS